MNPAKRKKIYRAALAEEAKKASVPVEQKKVEPVAEKPVELPMALKELPKEQPTVESVSVVTEQPVTTVEQASTTNTKKKKV